MPPLRNRTCPKPHRWGGPRGKGRLWITLLCALMGVCSVAEIPPEQVVGVYADTNPEHRNLSPLWGMVALRSGVLANIRFFGAYSSVPREHLPPLGPQYECPQDAVCAVMEYLFPSPDGINFVHNELTKDPIGQIAFENKENRKRGGGPGPWRSRELPRVCSSKTYHRNVCQGDSQIFKWHLACSSGKISGMFWDGISAN